MWRTPWPPWRPVRSTRFRPGQWPTVWPPAFVPGRMERYTSADGQICVIVDYSHNGMSLETALRSLRREYPGRELTVLFGCTGGKGLDRREGMGRAAGELADRILLTEDDPRPRGGRGYLPGRGPLYRRPGQGTTPWSPTGSVRWSGPFCRPPARRWCSWQARGARCSRRERTAPSPVCPTGSWPAGPLARYDGT